MDVKATGCWVLSLVLIQMLVCIDGFSKVPAEFRNTTWYTNVNGDVKFTTLSMQNWAITMDGQTIMNWLVMDDTRYTGTGGYLIFRSETNYTIKGTAFYAYMCMNLYRLKDNLYTYYSLHPQDSRFGNERVMLLETASIDMFEGVCDLNFVPNTDDINILARKGSESFTTCPLQLIDRIGFTAQNTNTTSLCAGVRNKLDGCSDTTRLQVTSTCSYPLLFSVNGTFSCLTEQAAGNDGIVYLLNMDNVVDDANTFRFSCMAISADGTIISVVPKRCLKDHTSTNFPSSTTGNRLFVKTRAVCSTQVKTTFDESKSLWIRIGIPVGVVILFLIVAAIFACVVCSRVRRRQMGYKKERRSSSRHDKGPGKRQIVIIEKVNSPEAFENPYVTADEGSRKAIAM